MTKPNEGHKQRKYTNSYVTSGLAKLLRKQTPAMVQKLSMDGWLSSLYTRELSWGDQTTAEAVIAWHRAGWMENHTFFMTMFYDYGDFQIFNQGEHEFLDMDVIKKKIPSYSSIAKEYPEDDEISTWCHAYTHLVFQDRGFCTMDEYLNCIQSAQGDEFVAALLESGQYNYYPPEDNEFECGYSIRRKNDDSAEG